MALVYSTHASDLFPAWRWLAVLWRLLNVIHKHSMAAEADDESFITIGNPLPEIEECKFTKV